MNRSIALLALALAACAGRADDAGSDTTDATDVPELTPEETPLHCDVEVDGTVFMALPDLEQVRPLVHFQRTRNYAVMLPTVVVDAGVATYQFPEGLAVYDVDSRSFEVADKRGSCVYE